MILVTGHRGAAGLAPENTLAGFRLAQKLGCHAVELDVHLTKDGHLAVIHDDTLDRTTNGSGPVGDRTMKELKTLDAGDGEVIPRLEEVLELFEGSGMRIQIELKGTGTEIVAPEIVKKAGFPDRITFTSSYHMRVYEAKKRLPEATAGILMSSNPVNPMQILEASGADNLHVKQNRLDERLVKEVHRGGRKLIAMGRIVEIPIINQVIDLGVDVIGSDRPDLVLKCLEERNI